MFCHCGWSQEECHGPLGTTDDRNIIQDLIQRNGNQQSHTTAYERAFVVEPVVVGEPAVGLGERDELAGALVIEPRVALGVGVEQRRHAGQRGEQLTDLGNVGGITDVDVRDLMVGDRERSRGPRIEVLHPVLCVDVQQPGPSQLPIDVDRA